MRRGGSGAVALLFCAAFAVRVVSLMYTQSPTIDEVTHVPAGYIYWGWKDFYINPEHPPLVKLVSAAGFVLSEGRIEWVHKRQAIHDFFAPDVQKRIFSARWLLLCFSLTLLAVVHATLRRLFDSRTAALGVIALSLFPTLIAHSVFVHTDLAASLFYFSAFSVLACWLTDRRPRWLWLLGGVLALGMLSKFSMTLAVINSAIAIIWICIRSRRFASWIHFSLACGLILTALAWLGFSGKNGDFGHLHSLKMRMIPLPNFYKEGWMMVWQHNARGHQNVFLTRNGVKGHVAYFPLAFLLKTPLPILIAIAFGIVLIFQRRRRIRWLWALFAATYWLSAVTSNINLGIRHILPVMVLMWIPLAACVHEVLHRDRWRPVAVLLFAWLVLGSFLNWGAELSYFNEVVGGGRYGWKYFGDSNVEWGQEVANLARFAKRNRLEPLYSDLFTNIPLSMYGVKDHPLGEIVGKKNIPAGWYAIGAHRLATNAIWPYSYFRKTPPDRVLSNSIFLYRVASPD
ncbi:MAG TPA: glycosyltransferase family 39 protein [Acidobacteriota bacterium]|jgi:4-amino-4-deoxy-L-arabinose transferase-like glycosyltransferase